MSPSQSITVKNPIAKILLHHFLDTLEVKPKTDVRMFCATKSNLKAIRDVIMLCSVIPKQRINTKINQRVKKALYSWILKYPRVMVSPISNDFIKLPIDGREEPQLFPKLLLQVSVREIHNIMVGPQEEGRLKESIDADNNIIISD